MATGRINGNVPGRGCVIDPMFGLLLAAVDGL